MPKLERSRQQQTKSLNAGIFSKFFCKLFSNKKIAIYMYFTLPVAIFPSQ
jgi:hypothetical protein